MAPTVKMELLRSLIVQCLSAAAEEIFKIAEKTIAEYEEETSRGSRWTMDGRWRCSDVHKSHSEENLQMSNADVQQTLPVSVNLDEQHDQETLVDNRMKQEFDQDASRSPERTEDRSSPSSSHRCQLCDRCFTCTSEFIVHFRTHQSQDCNKNFKMKGSPFTHRRKDAVETQDTETQQEQTEIKEERMNMKTSSCLHDSSESLQVLRLHQIQTNGDNDVSPTLTEDHIQTEASANGDASEQRDSNRLKPNQILCTMRTGQTTKLLVQLEAGTVEKPYKCPCCVKYFSLRKTLMRHMKIHTEDKPYMCRFCGRNFCQKSALICHTRVHTGEKPYGCHVCGFSFTQKCNLLTHMKKHEAEKPFP